MFLCKEIMRVWEKDETTLSQLSADIRYIINQAIKKGSSAVADVPDALEIIFNSGNFKDLLNKLTETLKIIFDVHKNTHEKRVLILIDKVKQYLDDNFTKVIVYKNFYDIFGYNGKYITVLFKGAYGISPSKYVMMRRIELAKHIMKRNPKIQVKDVAEMVGIPDSFYFSRIFKHREGLSPSAYLKNFQEG